MAYVHGQSQFVIAQPQGPPPAIVGNPFQQLQQEWSSGLCNCCENMSQCCFAYFCWHCFLCSLSNKINEPCSSCFCVPNALSVYRMKMRAVLKIRGTACGDVCTACWCPFCTGLQMMNELHNRGLA